jgi:pentatricopeptide repeat protein
MDFIDNMQENMDEVLFSSMIEACIRIGQLDLLSAKMRKYASQGRLVALTAPTYGSMIKAYGQAHDVERIWELWVEMRSWAVEPSAITLSSMVDALVMNDHLEDAWGLVQKVHKDESQSFPVDTEVYSTILKGYARLMQRKDREKEAAQAHRILELEVRRIQELEAQLQEQQQWEEYQKKELEARQKEQQQRQLQEQQQWEEYQKKERGWREERQQMQQRQLLDLQRREKSLEEDRKSQEQYRLALDERDEATRERDEAQKELQLTKKDHEATAESRKRVERLEETLRRVRQERDEARKKIRAMKDEHEATLGSRVEEKEAKVKELQEEIAELCEKEKGMKGCRTDIADLREMDRKMREKEAKLKMFQEDIQELRKRREKVQS